MIVLDGCCGAGGATRGYVDAGHEVWGIDIAPQPNYLKSGAAGFQQTDILQALREPWTARVDFIHVSPPCQFYSAMSRARPGVAEKYPDLIGPVRELLNATGKPWVIENVVAARPWMKDPVLLCAQQFRPGIPLYRHRLFETGGGFTLAEPPEPRGGISGTDRDYFTRDCGMLALAVARLTGWQPVEWVDESNAIHCLVRLPDGRLLDAGGLHDPGRYPGTRPLVPCGCDSCTEWNQPGVLADAQRLLRSIEPGRRKQCGWPHPVPASRAGHWEPGTAISVAGHAGNVELARKVMEIGWSTREELAEAIPPYYTRWVGEQIAGGKGVTAA